MRILSFAYLQLIPHVLHPDGFAGGGTPGYSLIYPAFGIGKLYGEDGRRQSGT